MKRSEIIKKLEQEMELHSYKSTMYEELAGIGFDAEYMTYKSNIEKGKAFGNFEIYHYITGKGNVDDIFKKGSDEAIRDAIEVEYNIIKMLNKIGVDGEWYYGISTNL